MRRDHYLSFLSVALLTIAVPASAAIVYVDDDAALGGNGASWKSAYTYLQDALTHAANPKNKVTEIRVAQGMYIPDRSDASPLGTGNPNATFQMPNLTVRGGYAGLGTKNPDANDPSVYKSTLNGQLDGANAYHVVTADGVTAQARLDGFTIRDGSAWDGSLQSKPVEDKGGGVYAINDSNLTITRTVFISNYAGVAGGAVSNTGSLSLWNCKFHGNTTNGFGGAINNSGELLVVNGVFTGNAVIDSAFPAGAGGGAIHNTAFAHVVSSSFAGNSVDAGKAAGGILTQNGITPAQLTIANSILWDNVAGSSADQSAQLAALSGTITINYSIVKGWTGFLGGLSNVSHDPMFVDPNGADNIMGTADDNLGIMANSVAIDSGNNWGLVKDVADLDNDDDTVELVPLDINGNPRVTNASGAISTLSPGCGDPGPTDRGAQEYAGSPGPGALYLADVNMDGSINVDDLLTVIGNWGPSSIYKCISDFDMNNSININDLLLLLNNWK